ncbi:MAG TPA: hypothetical protein VN706_03655 [Gemmatimonadaceae bacterium]|nr:hypothetical protein [Gemmatimonadaceae bacterium]
MVRSLTLAAAAAAISNMSLAAQGTDPRVGLRAGWENAGEAAFNMKLVAHVNRPANFVDTTNIGNFGFVNSDLMFRGNEVFQGSFHGFQVWDVSNAAHPRLRTSYVCPGGQGDLSVYHNLLFMSVEETLGRLDCGAQGVKDTVSKERFRGVRIFDISDLDHPKQIADVQTCRGSHTHTLVVDPKDTKNVYIYVSGTSPARSPNELAGCSNKRPEEDPNTSLFRIDVIQVPLAAPQRAHVISSPRIFADSAGHIAGLWNGGAHGEGTQTTTETNMCHDITVYSQIGLAAGACSGNGILLDIRNPAKPKRVAEVTDPNFAYWHSATFNNDGSKVIFTDEWGGGVAPRCRSTDKPTWGADALFSISRDHGVHLTPGGYYKLPAPQTAYENCVAHNGSLVPVPGRDIMVQAWYQGGVSVFDFSDVNKPKEIAFFDRGPLDSTKLILGGQWSAYWYNGHIYGSEIARGLDVLDLTPSEFLTQNEIDAAKSVHVDVDNPQNQQRIVWPASFSLSRAYLDQLVRDHGISADRTTAIGRDLDAAEQLKGGARSAVLRKLGASVDADAKSASDAAKVRLLAKSIRDLASK